MTDSNQLHCVPGIAEGLKYLQANDSVFKTLPVYEGHLWPRFDPGFAGLVRVVMGQQVSIKAANALWRKLNETINPLTPENIMVAEGETLRAAGMSRQKSSYLKGLAEAIHDERLVIEELELAPDKEVIRQITSLRGFGVWSAHMYLMFALGRPDVWPSGDLGIRMALKHYSGLRDSPGPEEAQAMKDKFSPYCTAASLLLWQLNAAAK